MTDIERIKQLEEQVALLEKDKEMLDWLQSNLDRYDIQCNLAAISPFWFTRGHGHKVIAFAQGKDIRTAITNSMRKEGTE